MKKITNKSVFFSRINLNIILFALVVIIYSLYAIAVPVNFVNEEIIIENLTLPTFMEFLPDGRMLIGEFQGTIRIVQSGSTQIDPTPFLQIPNFFTDDAIAGGERGLVGLTLDPNFSINGFFYVFYTAKTPQRDRVSRFTAVGNSADPTSEVVIWQGVLDSTSTDHHGGTLAFGPDGKLYISTGDNGDPSSSQDLISDHGKILRVNSDGTIPTDNPFFDGIGPNIDAIWVRGLRNPFRFSFDTVTGKIYIGDVGSTLIEEVNLGIAGANYGWPVCEGICGTAGMTNPIYSYSHNGRDASITGGVVYRGNQFPQEYSRGAYFFGDYAQNWIKVLTFDSNGDVNATINFEPIDGSLDGPYGDPVEFEIGQDGSLYYVDFGGFPGNPAAIRRIRYTAANQPPVANASASPISGPPPLNVSFSSAGSFDPEGANLTYNWTFGDGNVSIEANPVHVYNIKGMHTVRLAVSDGVTTVLSSPITITVGNAPVPVINSPINGNIFTAGDVINFSGNASDIEDGTLPPSALTWTILFHHDTHVHPALGPVSGILSGTFNIHSSGHDFSGDTSYEFILTATDSDGIQSSTSAFIFPQKVNLTFLTLPVNLTLIFDGVNRIAPFVKDTLVGFQHTISAPNQTVGSTQYNFVSWSDGGQQTHNIIVPNSNQAHMANYSVSPIPTTPSLVLAYSFNEASGTTAADSSGNGKTATLVNGPTFTAGKYGNAVDLDGINDYAIVANPNLPTGDFTYEAWLNPDDVSGFRGIMVPENNELEFDTGDGGILIYTNGVQQFITSTTIPTLAWTHVALTRQGSTIRVYINGNLEPETGTDGGALTFGCGLLIGVDADSGCTGLLNGYFDGKIDEIRVYNRSLTQAEIQSDMNTPVI